MMIRNKVFLSLLLMLMMSGIRLYATHNRAGEITFTQIGPLTFEFTVTTYTDPSVQADRCSLEILYGDSTSEEIPRINGTVPCNSFPNSFNGVVIVPGRVRLNIYKGTHTYPGPGRYRVSVTDPNRNQGVINIPNSVNQVFYIETSLRISTSPITGGFNSSPILLNPPIDEACYCKRFIHNPGAYDPDFQDSLSYTLANCKGLNGQDISGYFVPSGVVLNPITGDMVWECPGPQIGEYNFAILIISWRNGVAIDTVRRDMQVNVVGICNNDPPVVEAQDLCVDAGTQVTMPITATDPNNHPITLTSTSVLYAIPNNPAVFQQPVTGQSPITNNFNWNTNCSHVKLASYQVTFKAEDSPPPPSISLVDMKTVQITVVSPGPENLNAVSQGTSIFLNWDACPCTQALGYRIYRKSGPSGFVPAQCETGIPASTGYVQIGTVNGVNNLSFVDNNNGSGLIHGVEYCYMIYAFFADGAKSYASNEVCTMLKKDVPIITNVSVNITDNGTGENYIAWSKPDINEIDTLAFPSPYYYIVHRSTGSNGLFFAVVDSTSPVIGLNDTIFIHNGLNTQTISNSYRIELISAPPGNRKSMGFSPLASSVFLESAPGDNKVMLNWSAFVPWTEDTFIVYRQNPLTLDFDSIATTTVRQYTDEGLANGREVCYKVLSSGFYSASGFVNPILNYSQIRCDIPIDNEPPCPPSVEINSSCDSILNTLQWISPLDCADDVLQYQVFYSPVLGDPFFLIATIDGINNTILEHNNNGISIAGCYYLVSSDSATNLSIPSDTICVDNCPIYELPNVFSPNNDGVNDFFRPFPYRFIESIDMQIFNRWGNLIFTTSDPEVLWDGRNMTSNQPSSDGVYYYVCKVNEIRLEGIKSRTLQGFVQLFQTAPNNKGN
jgi:gliding motility-associated-like protein